MQVEDPDKEVVWASEVEGRRVLEPAVAYLVNDALREALLRGTGQTVRQAGFQGAAAGKTGTTNDGTDAWFVGYDPQVVATVWIGFDRPQPIMAKATGGRLAAPVWARIMERFYAGRSRPQPWPQPNGIVAAVVDPDSGLVLAPGCHPLTAVPYRELFISSRVPRESCPSYGQPPPLEPYMDFGTEVDEEIMAEPLDLEPPTTAARAAGGGGRGGGAGGGSGAARAGEPPPPPPGSSPSHEPAAEPPSRRRPRLRRGPSRRRRWSPSRSPSPARARAGGDRVRAAARAASPAPPEPPL